MKVGIALGGSLLALAGCTTLTNTDEAIKKNLHYVCSGAEIAYAAVLEIDKFHPLREDWLASAKLAYDDLQGLCEKPDDANLANVLVKVMNAARNISVVLYNAKQVEDKNTVSIIPAS